jgi:hypothetical protein
MSLSQAIDTAIAGAKERASPYPLSLRQQQQVLNLE